MPSKLEEKLRSTEFTHEEEEEAIEAVERSGISLRYILDSLICSGGYFLMTGVRSLLQHGQQRKRQRGLSA